MEKELKAKPITKLIYQQLRDYIAENEIKPVLALVLIGTDPAAEFYVQSIKKNAGKVGIEVVLYNLEAEVTESELLNRIEEFNAESNINGIMIQKPLPKGIDDSKVAAAILPDKDVDGFHPINLGKLMLEAEGLEPCTPQAVREIISYYGIELKGRHTVLCGRSNIVGKPLANMLIGKNEPGNATLTICHSRTRNLTEYTKQADILITALGLPRFIKAEMVKDGAVIIDVGTNEIEQDGKKIYVGDVDYEQCYPKALAVTPVPGGVGSVTTALLLKNILKAYQLQHNLPV